MPIYLGVDTGALGATVLYDSTEGTPLEYFDMPMVPTGTKGRPVLDTPELYRYLLTVKERYPAVTAIVEQVGAMPRQSAQSGFSQGRTYGATLAVISVVPIGYKLVSSLAWKKDCKAYKKPKDYTNALAKQQYPSFDVGAKAKGRADALYIAKYGNKL